MRAGDWWDFKLVPILSAFYATALMLGVAVSSLWLPALTLLLSIIACAAYVSLINDVTDRREDAAAGKPNRIEGRSALVKAAMLAVPIIAGFGFVILWRDDPLLVMLYLGAWVAFALYSLPPFRFKARGILGVLADASGAHLFPTLLAVMIACRGANRIVSLGWIVAVGTWAFACGVRGILWHQLVDLRSDALIGARTFAQRYSAHTVSRLGTFVIFPLEVAALAVLLWQLSDAASIVMLVVYGAFAVARTSRMGVSNVIVVPKPRYRTVMNEYYECFLPIALLGASALRHPGDWLVLAIHLVLFRERPRQILIDAWQTVRVGREARRI
ncbi:MAG: UbiA family prenyltransferase [Gemmatimonadota bacterium]